MAIQSGESGKMSSRYEDTLDPMRLAFVQVIEALRPGEVTSYAEVAAKAGYPRRHRAVGQLLGQSFDALPWWRVIYSSGHLPPVNPGLQEERLRAEGVAIERMKVVDAPHGMFSQAE
ncbi:MGMT family protein [Neorhodopirellula lusitana]|nr:MGMT family protein [Neorhodopirellula lusitana]